MSEKPAGKTFNIKEVAGKSPEGKAIWKSYGRTFVRSDLSGGALWVGDGDAEKTYALVPREGTPKAGGKTFEVVDKAGEGEPKHIGRLYIRPDLSGGALWVGKDDNETEYAVFLRDFKRKATQKSAEA
jgi:hypothetical protein